MKLTKHYSFAVIFLTFFSLLFQQDITVKGKVTGENGDALVGANIMVKGTFTGVSTNIDGEFSITVDKNAILITTYIGYNELNITANEILNISLIKNVLNTEEIVVFGLASSVKRKNLANSVATVSGDELVIAPTQTLDGTLSGKFAGANLTLGNTYASDDNLGVVATPSFGVWFDVNDQTSIGWENGVKVSLSGPGSSDFRLGYDGGTSLGVSWSWWEGAELGWNTSLGTALDFVLTDEGTDSQGDWAITINLGFGF